jgi:hypothetical protein
VAQLWLAAIPAPPKGSNRAAAIVGGTRHKRKVPNGAPSHDGRPLAGILYHTCRTGLIERGNFNRDTLKADTIALGRTILARL